MEMNCCYCRLSLPSAVSHFSGDQFSLAFARIENHYFMNGEKNKGDR